jgi:hypothetical protein
VLPCATLRELKVTRTDPGVQLSQLVCESDCSRLEEDCHMLGGAISAPRTPMTSAHAYGIAARRRSISSTSEITGLETNEGRGSSESHLAPGGKTAATSQTIGFFPPTTWARAGFDLRREPALADNSRRLSQYCETLSSDTNESALEVGGAKSLHKTGSQTTNTRIRCPPTVLSAASSAEAPRTQTGQVGESSARTRVWSAAALNAERNSSRFCSLR